MTDRDPARVQSTEDVKSDLSKGLKSCTKLLASYRDVFTHDGRLKMSGWKR